MTSSPEDLPLDLAACQARVRALQAELAERNQTIEEQQLTIERLGADLKLLQRSLFGPRRERYVDDPAQALLFGNPTAPDENEAAEATADESVPLVDEGVNASNTTPSAAVTPPADAQLAESTSATPAGEDVRDSAAETTSPPVPPRRTSSGRRARVFPEFLPRTRVEHRLDEADIPESLRNDPSAKRFFKKISETIELEPQKLHVLEHYQEVIVCEADDAETTLASAPRRARIISAYAEPGLLAYLTASRFADHLPYYRQEDILSRARFRISRSTQCRWMMALAEAVHPLVEMMRELTLQSLVCGIDETPVRLLQKLIRGSLKSYLWGTVGDRQHPYDCFYFTTDRSRTGPEAFLQGFQGYLQADAYIAYERIALDHDGMFKVGCWAHARRKFEEVHFTGPTVRTHVAMGYLRRLYEIEQRDLRLTDEQRYELRQREAKPLLEAFHAWLTEQHATERPKSKLRSAIGYVLNRWNDFTRYLEHGAIPIDNNRTEASLKFAILGRKAWLFFGNEQGGETAARLFTLTKSCNRHHIDPVAYLRDLYTRLPSLNARELEQFLPDRWIAAHPEHRIQERADEAAQRAERTRRRRAARAQAA